MYDPREEHSVMTMMKVCGHYIKPFIFPNHVTQSKLIEMVNRINVSCLSLPAVTVLDLDELKQLLQPMSRLEKLEVELITIILI